MIIDATINKIILSDIPKHEKLSLILKYLFVDICDINQKKYYILGSYAIREHRKISDLDINLDHDEFFKVQNLITKSLGTLEIYNNQIRYFYDMTNEYNIILGTNEKDFSIEAFQKLQTVGFPNDNFSLAYLTKNLGLDKDKNGHQFFNLSTLLLWKKTMNREKDIPDIKLLESLTVMKGGNGSKKTKKKKNSKI